MGKSWHLEASLAAFRRATLRACTTRRFFSTSRQRPTRWGFIGLGRMGYPIAKNLRLQIPTSDTLTVYDINKEASKRFAQEVDGHVIVATSPRTVANTSETTFTALPETSHVRSVFGDILQPPLADDAISERLYIDLSTIDPLVSKEIARSVRDVKGGVFVDAPMSGGVVGAEAGSLTFMLGAPEDVAKRVMPLLSLIGRRVVHCGSQGSGLAAKLANNYLLAISNIATAEAMNMGLKWGIDPRVLGSLINVSSGRCWSSEVNNPVPGVVENAPSSNHYSGGFSTTLMIKDLKLAIEAANDVGAKLVLHEKAQSVYEETLQNPEFKNKDFSIVYKFLQAKSV